MAIFQTLFAVEFYAVMWLKILITLQIAKSLEDSKGNFNSKELRNIFFANSSSLMFGIFSLQLRPLCNPSNVQVNYDVPSLHSYNFTKFKSK
jgi:hypothetical protein